MAPACDTCRKFSKNPFHFRNSLSPERIAFNHDLSVELFWIEVNNVIDIFDTPIHLHNPITIQYYMDKDIRNTLLEGWESL